MTKKPALRGKSKPDFGRVPTEVVDRGIKMLRDGISAARVMRALNVSYPTVLKWKRAEKLPTPRPQKRTKAIARKVAVELDRSVEPTRRQQVIAEELLESLMKVLQAGCTIGLSRDRDHFISELLDFENRRTVTQNRTPELAVMDALGKYARLRQAPTNGHSTEPPNAEGVH